MLNGLRMGAGMAIAALILTGCGGDDDTTTTSGGDTDVDPQEDPAAYFEAVSAATEDAGTYRMDISMSGAAAAGQSGDMSALVVADGDELITKISPSGEGPEIIQAGETFYMKGMPDLAPEYEDKWLTLDLGGAFGQMMGSSAAPTDMVDPDIFASVGDIDVSVADGGEVDGVATQEISFTLTADQLAENVPDDNPMAETVKGQLQDTDYVLKVGDDLLVREVSVSSGSLMTMDGTMYDYGIDETIDVPAEGDTVSMEEAISGSMGDLEGGDLGNPGDLEDSMGDLEDELGDLEDELGGSGDDLGGEFGTES